MHVLESLIVLLQIVEDFAEREADQDSILLGYSGCLERIFHSSYIVSVTRDFLQESKPVMSVAVKRAVHDCIPVMADCLVRIATNRKKGTHLRVEFSTFRLEFQSALECDCRRIDVIAIDM